MISNYERVLLPSGDMSVIVSSHSNHAKLSNDTYRYRKELNHGILNYFGPPCTKLTLN